jgi:hypothetical protein
MNEKQKKLIERNLNQIVYKAKLKIQEEVVAEVKAVVEKIVAKHKDKIEKFNSEFKSLFDTHRKAMDAALNELLHLPQTKVSLTAFNYYSEPRKLFKEDSFAGKKAVEVKMTSFKGMIFEDLLVVNPDDSKQRNSYVQTVSPGGNPVIIAIVEKAKERYEAVDAAANEAKVDLWFSKDADEVRGMLTKLEKELSKI